MKLLSLLLCLLSLAAPLWAQNTNDKPKEFGFTFNYEYSDKTRITSFDIGYARQFLNAKPVPFDVTTVGKQGLISQETLSFIDDKGEVMGTLSSEFDATGRLQNQNLNEAKGTTRALDWFKTAQKSPQLSVAGSVLQARYTLKNGKLSERLLTLKLPGGTRKFLTHYDEQGRRDNDEGTSDSGPIGVHFFYGEEGLIRFTATGGQESPHEITLLRAPDGTLSQIATKADGVLIGRMFPNFDDKNQNSGIRIESFEGGLLSSVATMNFKAQSTTQEEYDRGVLLSRKVLTVDAKEGKKLQSLEEFEGGHLQKHTDYDEDGAVKTITTFNPDGSVGTTQNFQNGVEVAPAK